MKTEELIATLRVCADDDIICPACERYNTMGKWGGTARCYEDLMLKAAEALERLETELKEERYRHDRLQDFEVAEAEELRKAREQLRWIPVTERLPELIPCAIGSAYSEAVIVWTSGRKAMVAVWDGTDFLRAASYWEDWGEDITHWMPLPEPPREVGVDG